LLSRYPQQFVLADNPPYNHVMISPSRARSNNCYSAYSSARLQPPPAAAPRKQRTGSSKGSQAGRSHASPVAAAVVDTAQLEREILTQSHAILHEASQRTLKAVELANTLRARMGTEALANVRERCGGLLTVLEKYPATFLVRRIPKSDTVSLIGAAELRVPPLQQSPGLEYGLMPTSVSANSLASSDPSEDALMVQGPELDLDPTLTMLTSEFCVPTQIWHVDQFNDWRYVNLIVSQLSMVGGTATVSKLRGLMKEALGCPKSIKSVPLKAFLAAYHRYFQVVGNRVNLVSALHPPPAALDALPLFY
jgi:hypothetical protein